MVILARFLTVAIGSVACALATPVNARPAYKIKEIHNIPQKWTKVGDAPQAATIELHIALKQSRWDELERHLYEVSDPSHQRYRNHLTADEVNNLVQPQKDAIDRVNEWLLLNGVDETRVTHTPAKDWLKVSMPVCDAERLLDTKYSVYKHEDGTQLIRTPQWSLPEYLHEDIMAIQPTNSFLRASAFRTTFKPVDPDTALVDQPTMSDAQSLYAKAGDEQDNTRPDVQTACNVTGITPQCLRTLYNTVNYQPVAAGKNKVAFCNYLNETANTTDLNLFINRYRPDAQGTVINFEIINNGANQQTPLDAMQLQDELDAEGNLDAQTLIGITHPMNISAYNTGGSPPFNPDLLTPTDTNEPYADWLNYILQKSDGDLPQTISTSYGDDEQTVPPSYAQAVCQQFAQLGARGVTLLFASGDNGVGRDGTCVSNDGQQKAMFVPTFPAGCPYVTVVGATKNVNPEVAAFDPRNGFSSGGGFSNYFARPSYQDTVVSQYANSLPSNYSTWFNRTGRAYPDIAAQGQSFIVVWNGKDILLDGTSASTPTMAGVIALVNDNLVASGKAPMGFMNPWLYKVGYQAFTDITSGNARGCNSSGFPAQTGWDAVTGFGTPDFEKIRQLANAPTAGFIGNPGSGR